MLEKLELVEVDEIDTSAIRLRFPPAPRSGNYPVQMEGVGKAFGDKRIFSDVNLMIERGDKIAFVGKNGEGKSTLVRCIMKELEHEGVLTLGHNVQIGYFAQNQAAIEDETRTVFQTIDDVAEGEIRTKIKDLLGAFMFGGEASTKKVKVLSGGERTRLALLKLLLEPYNLLILDEPTNHLDMKTKEVLKQALLNYDARSSSSPTTVTSSTASSVRSMSSVAGRSPSTSRYLRIHAAQEARESQGAGALRLLISSL